MQRAHAIWEFAKNNAFCIVTNDQDFEELISLYGFPPKVILLKCGNQANSYLISYLHERLDDILAFMKDDSLGILNLY
jgi:predicted nuclease of predicted toxin-antitoxin system